MKFATREKIFLIVAAAVVIRVALIPLQGYESDLNLFKFWAAHLAVNGFVGLETLPDSPVSVFPSYALYFPVLWVVGKLWVAFMPPTSYVLPTSAGNLLVPAIELFSLWGTIVVKIPSLVADFAMGFTIFQWARRVVGEPWATRALALALLNPAMIYVTAYWGQTDSIHSLLIVVAFLALTWGRPLLAFLAIGSAVFIKPQSVIFFPVLAVALVSRFSLKDLMRYGAASALLIALALGFIFSKTPMHSIAQGLRHVSVAYPYLSKGAINIWAPWQARVGMTVDDRLIVMGMTMRTWGLVLLGVMIMFLLLAMRRRAKDTAVVFAAATLSGMAFFLLPTEMHERYLYPIFPLLTLLVVLRPRLLGVWAILSAAFLANLLFVLPFLDLWDAHLVPRGFLMYGVLAAYLLGFIMITYEGLTRHSHTQ